MNKIKIVFGGKERQFTFGVMVTGQILKHLEIPLSQLGEQLASNPFITYPTILFYGAKQAANKNEDVFDTTFDDVCEWIEEEGLTSKGILEIVTCFSESIQSLLPADKKKAKKIPEAKKK